MTVKVDITHLVEICKRKEYRFYPILTWVVTSALNQFKHFKMGFNMEGMLGYFDKINPMYSVIDSKENVVSLCTVLLESRKLNK